MHCLFKLNCCKLLICYIQPIYLYNRDHRGVFLHLKTTVCYFTALQSIHSEEIRRFENYLYDARKMPEKADGEI